MYGYKLPLSHVFKQFFFCLTWRTQNNSRCLPSCDTPLRLQKQSQILRGKNRSSTKDRVALSSFELFCRNTANSLLILLLHSTAPLPCCWSWWKPCFSSPAPRPSRCPPCHPSLPSSTPCPATWDRQERLLWAQRHLSGPSFAPHCPGPSPNLLLVKRQHTSFSVCRHIPKCFGVLTVPTAVCFPIQALIWQRKKNMKLSIQIITEQNLNTVAVAACLISFRVWWLNSSKMHPFLWCFLGPFMPLSTGIVRFLSWNLCNV